MISPYPYLDPEAFCGISSPCPAKEGSDRAAAVGTWHPARLKPPHELTWFYYFTAGGGLVCFILVFPVSAYFPIAANASLLVQTSGGFHAIQCITTVNFYSLVHWPIAYTLLSSMPGPLIHFIWG